MAVFELWTKLKIVAECQNIYFRATASWARLQKSSKISWVIFAGMIFRASAEIIFPLIRVITIQAIYKSPTLGILDPRMS